MNYTPHIINESKVIKIENDDKLKHIANSSYPKVLYFTAKWCGPCQRIQPVYIELARKYESIKFLKIDVDENPALSADFRISSMPTFIFLKSDNDHKFFTGADNTKLEQHIKWLLN
jgi:thioredoxin 1